jgi:transcription elongation factor Elf1
MDDMEPPVLEEEGDMDDMMDMPEEAGDDAAAAGGDQQGEQFQCSVCPFKSYSVTLVQRHETIAHLKKKFFRCTKCNYVTHLKARFTKHVKYHSMPMIKCDLCDFRTPYKWNLDRHYRNHQGDGEFKCPLCNFRADIKQSLTVHVQNHHLTPQQKALRGVNRRNKVNTLFFFYILFCFLFELCHPTF